MTGQITYSPDEAARKSPHFGGGHCALTDRPVNIARYIGANRTPDVNGEPMMKIGRTAITLVCWEWSRIPFIALRRFEETARQVIIAFQQRDNTYEKLMP